MRKWSGSLKHARLRRIGHVTINCSTVDKQTSRKQINKNQTDGWGYTNKELDSKALLQCTTKKEGIKSYNINPTVMHSNKSIINYFLPSPCQEADKKTS